QSELQTRQQWGEILPIAGSQEPGEGRPEILPYESAILVEASPLLYRRSGFNRSTMSAFTEHQESLQKHEFMMGTARGRLAVTMDVLTDALVLAGQHAVYMQMETKSKRVPRDVQMMMK